MGSPGPGLRTTGLKEMDSLHKRIVCVVMGLAGSSHVFEARYYCGRPQTHALLSPQPFRAPYSLSASVGCPGFDVLTSLGYVGR